MSRESVSSGQKAVGRKQKPQPKNLNFSESRVVATVGRGPDISEAYNFDVGLNARIYFEVVRKLPAEAESRWQEPDCRKTPRVTNPGARNKEPSGIDHSLGSKFWRGGND